MLDRKARVRTRPVRQARNAPSSLQAGLYPAIRTHLTTGRFVGEHLEPKQSRPVHLTGAQVVAQLRETRIQFGIHASAPWAELRLVKAGNEADTGNIIPEGSKEDK